MKVVAYCCTANWYEHLKVAVNSLDSALCGAEGMVET